ncbi:hypothetical protein, partial [Bacillus cereus]|uniref:hypothetical protein n=1 Tax=Bacillus cereus TaxID=1396 RepID=UPI000BEB5111
LAKMIKQCIFYKQIIFFKRVKLYLKFTKRLLLSSLKIICDKNIEKEKAAKAAIEEMKKRNLGKYRSLSFIGKNKERVASNTQTGKSHEVTN